MRIAPLADVKARLSAYLEDSRTQGPLIITKNGRPVGVLIAPEDEGDLERLVLSRSPTFQALLAKSRRSIAAGKGLTEEEFWSQVDKDKGKPRTPRRK
jgi:prevent-host-death family protein